MGQSASYGSGGSVLSIEDNIKQKLQSAFHVELLEVVNESPLHQTPENAETHFRILLVSKDFEGLNLVQRHSKVYKALAEELAGPVHAFSQKTLTPSEWHGGKSSLSSSPPCRHKL